MIGRRSVLRILTACLSLADDRAHREALTAQLRRRDLDWMALLALANDHALTPALHARLAAKSCIGELPDDVAAYLAELHRRSAERDRRLRGQAEEAISALNAVGVEPMLLKGGALLFKQTMFAPGDRLLVDLDLLVPHDAVAAASAALARQGYAPAPPPPKRSMHSVGDFRRADEVGAIDLHVELISMWAHDRANQALPLASAEVWLDSERKTAGRASFRVPAPAHHVLHLVLHDQVHEMDHYFGRLNLHHLLDVAVLLAAEGAQTTWPPLLRRLDAYGLRSAWESHVLAAHDLFAGPLPAPLRPWRPHLHHQRRLLQQHCPVPDGLGRTAGRVAWAFARCRFGPLPPGATGAALLLGRRLRHAAHLISRGLWNRG